MRHNIFLDLSLLFCHLVDFDWTPQLSHAIFSYKIDSCHWTISQLKKSISYSSSSFLQKDNIEKNTGGFMLPTHPIFMGLKRQKDKPHLLAILKPKHANCFWRNCLQPTHLDFRVGKQGNLSKDIIFISISTCAGTILAFLILKD